MKMNLAAIMRRGSKEAGEAGEAGGAGEAGEARGVGGAVRASSLAEYHPKPKTQNPKPKTHS